MTAPGATPPENSFVVGSGFGQDITEESADAVIKQEAEDVFLEAADNFRSGILGDLEDIPHALNMFAAEFLDKIDGATGGFFNLDDLADRIRAVDTAASAAQSTASSAASTASSAASTASTANSAANAAQSLAEAVQTVANDAASSAAAANNALAEIRAQNSGSTSNGVRLHEVFNGSTIPTSTWNVYGTNLGIESTTARILSAATTDGWRHIIHKTSIGADAMNASAVFGTSTNLASATGLMVRATSNGSSFVYAVFYSNKFYLGRGTWNSGTGAYVFTDWNPGGTTWDTRNGSLVELHADGNQYQVLIDAYPVLNYTDTGNTATVGASNRYAGLLFSRSTTIGTWRSAGVSTFNAVDATTPATVGTGWILYRSTTTAGSDIQDGYTLLPGTSFDNQMQVANVIVTNQATGQITIQKAGWYMISLRYQLNLGIETADSCKVVLYSNIAAGGSNFAIVDVGAQNDGTSNFNVEGAFIRYCEIGESLRPGFFYDKGIAETPTKLVGDTLGSVTYFKGALLNN